MNKEKVLALGISIVLFVFNNLLISTILFISKCSITKWNFLIATFLTLITYVIYMKKNNYKLLEKIVFPIILLIIIAGSIMFSTLLYDNSWDGASYHKTAIGELKNGWNPVYENIEDFNKSENNKIKLTNSHELWANHYAKAYWIFAANAYALTNNIESGKMLQIVTIIATFLISYSLINEKLKKTYSIIISLLLAFNPVMIYQIATFYNDGLLGNYVIILLILLLSIFDNPEKNMKLEKWFLYFLVLSILINIKFTGFAYAGIYSLLFYIYSFLSKEKRQLILKNMTITAAVSLLIGVGLIGGSSYIKNTIDHHHPFYPLYGKDKVDIMEAVTPKGLYDMNRFKRFALTNFSTSESATEGIYKIKIPFTFKVNELQTYKYSDVTIEGYGVVFGGILIFSIIVGIITLIKAYKQKQTLANYLIVIGGMLLIIIIMKESWWARYFPQFYLVPFIVILMLLKTKNKKSHIMFVNIILMLLIINSYLIINPAFEEIRYQIKIINKQNNYIKNLAEDRKIKIVTASRYSPTPMFDGLVYNIYDNHKNIEVIEYTEEIKGYEKYEYFGDSPLINIFIEKN